MGALQKIRDRGSLLIAVLGVALLFFILGELFTSGNTWLNKFKDKAFTVDGVVVSTGAFQGRVSQFEDFQKFISGQNSLDENVRAQIGEFVYEQMVKEIILDNQAEKLGLAVTKEEMTDMVYGANISPILLQLPIFTDPQTGQFSREGLIQFLSFVQTDIKSVPDEQKMQLYSFQQQWAVIENMMKYQRIEEKYNTLISSAVSANNVEAKTDFNESKSYATLAYALSRYSAVPDSAVTVSEKEIEALYKERKNNYKVPTELRRITYVTQRVQPSQADVEAVQNQMNTVYEKLQATSNPALIVSEYSDEPYRDIFFSTSMLSPDELQFAQNATIGDVRIPEKQGDAYRTYKLVDRINAPDSVKLQMIVLPEAELVKADSILNVIKGGKAFEAVAAEMSIQNNGEIGWVTEPMLNGAGNDFIRSVFKASKGELLKLTNRNAIQIVKVNDVTRPVSKYKLALVQMPIGVSDKTVMDIDNDLNTFIAENANAANFYEAAIEKQYNVMPDVTIAPANLGLPQIEGSRPVIHWAFNEKTGVVKKFDLPNYRIVAVVNQIIDGGYLPVKDVSDALKAELIRDKKAEKIIADLKTKAQTTLEGYAQVMNAKVDTASFVRFNTPSVSGLGREPMFNVYALLGQVNKVDGPLKGNNGVFVLTTLNRVEDQTVYNEQQIKESLSYSLRNRFSPMYVFNTLQEKSDVKDNRVTFF